MNLSQAKFGKLVGVTGTSVYKWEFGRAKPHHVFADKIQELMDKNSTSKTAE